jgi:hypothetical protein
LSYPGPEHATEGFADRVSVRPATGAAVRVHHRRALRGGQPDALQRLLDVSERTQEPVYGFRSLLAFKAKFHRQDREKIPITWVRRASPAFGQQAGLRG